MSNLVSLFIFLISLLCVAYGIYYNLIVSIAVGLIGACYAVYMYNTLKELDSKKNFISSDELKDALVKIEQETAPAPAPVEVKVAPEVPKAAAPKSVKRATKPKAPTPAMKATNSVKEPPKKRGRKPAVK